MRIGDNFLDRHRYGAIADLIHRSHLERRALVGADANTKSAIVNDHYTILKALADRDPTQAEAVVRKHFEIGVRIRREMSLRFGATKTSGG